MRPRTALLLFAALAVGCANATVDAGVEHAARRAAATVISPELMGVRIGFLASDELAGRDTPSPGLETAAAWIADEFARVGLEPGAGDDWIQRYPFPLVGLDRRETRVEISGGATHTLQLGLDFFAEPGAAPPHAAGIMYVAGPDGVTANPGGALRDRVVLIRLEGLPASARGGLRFDGATRATIREAAARAHDAGATGVVFALDERVTRAQVDALAETAALPRRMLGGPPDDGDPALFFVTHTAALRIFRMAGLDGAEMLRRERVDRPVPLPGVTVRLGAPWTTTEDASAPNVLGLLRGSDPELADTYVVLSAHIDHVGVGPPDEHGDSIYNGADDNASGTAAIMAIAEAFAALPERPARSVLFLGVSGEEKGLLGSRWFVEHPTVPRDRIVANINMDMIGRNAPDSIVVIGKEYSSLGEVVRRVADGHPEIGLAVAPDPWPEQRFFFRSDHYSFAAREIPAIFFFAGVHEDYHRPGDTADRIDNDKAARVARLAFLVAHEVARDERPPEWDPAGLEQVRSASRR